MLQNGDVQGIYQWSVDAGFLLLTLFSCLYIKMKNFTPSPNIKTLICHLYRVGGTLLRRHM